MTVDIDAMERLANAGVTRLSEVKALIAEVRALREDAERYQYLRMCGRPSRVRLVDQYDMTKAIDAARRSK